MILEVYQARARNNRDQRLGFDKLDHIFVLEIFKLAPVPAALGKDSPTGLNQKFRVEVLVRVKEFQFSESLIVGVDSSFELLASEVYGVAKKDRGFDSSYAGVIVELVEDLAVGLLAWVEEGQDLHCDA